MVIVAQSGGAPVYWPMLISGTGGRGFESCRSSAPTPRVERLEASAFPQRIEGTQCRGSGRAPGAGKREQGCEEGSNHRRAFPTLFDASEETSAWIDWRIAAATTGSGAERGGIRPLRTASSISSR
jgi:hypothetical protein